VLRINAPGRDTFKRKSHQYFEATCEGEEGGKKLPPGQPLSIPSCKDCLMNIKIDSLNPLRILSLNDLGTPLAPHVAEKSLQQPIATAAMNRRICICCGEPMAATGNSLSRNPNVCASCSSLSDGMEEEGNQAIKNDEASNTPGTRSPTTISKCQERSSPGLAT